MKKEDINKAFEGRLRLKGLDDFEDCEVRQLSGKYIKDLLFDFFEAGTMLGEGFRTAEITFPNEEKVTFVYKRDLTLDTLDDGFSIFWALYEKKVGRPKCEKLWAKLSVKEKEECIAYIPYYKQAQPDKQYRKNPETFLRNKSWNDELIYRNGTSQPTINEQRTEKLADILTD